jgi:alkanesulfonate monooxygenase SsuD/methylene tetrahydromethanopterin reductase-like flavin-dependent oxidoreductase (luciferase family)
MKLGLALPTSTAVTGDAPLAWARMADEGGFDSVWVIDRVVFPVIEALTTLAAVAGVTSRVKLGTSVLLGPTRDPVLLASQVASIDVLSNGRMLLGLGVGSRAEDYTATERDFHTRGRRLDANIEKMQRIWAGEPIVEGFAPVGPRPVNGTIPLLFGGSSDAAMARAARLGQGHLCVPRSVEIQHQMFEKFRAAWSAAGRTERPVLYAQSYFCVDSSVEHARERLADYQEHYYGRRPRASGGTAQQSEFDLVGPPDAIAESMLKYERLGADALVLFPATADPAQAEALVGPVHEAYRKLTGN